MASVKQEADKDRKPMAANIVATKAEEPDDDDDKSPARIPAKRADAGPAFFTIYKRGQGKWTRLGTVFVAAGLGLLTAYNLYGHYLMPYLPAAMPDGPTAAQHAAHLASMEHVRQISMLFLGASVAFLIGFSFFVFWIINKPSNADFLIATDSEMKKVNWTTKGELYGSTRVVCLFLFFIAVFLLLVDTVFASFFRFIKVLI
jgi:preprotein translocase SecE subunit